MSNTLSCTTFSTSGNIDGGGTLVSSSDIDLSNNGSYQIGGVSALTSTTLGSNITSSSLTSLGTLNDLSVTGNLIIDSPTLTVDATNNRVGISNSTPQYSLDVSGDTNLSTDSSLKIAGTNVLSSTTLGSEVIGSSLTSLGTLTSLTVTGDVNIDSSSLKVDSTNNRVGIVNASPAYTLDVTGSANISTGSSYKIAGTDVLSGTTLGTTVVNSSLTTVGTLSSLSVSGDVTIDSSTVKVDSTNNRVGIVNSTPAYTLDVTGDCNIASGSTFKVGGTCPFQYAEYSFTGSSTVTTTFSTTYWHPCVSQFRMYSGQIVANSSSEIVKLYFTSSGGYWVINGDFYAVNESVYVICMFVHKAFTGQTPTTYLL